MAQELPVSLTVKSDSSDARKDLEQLQGELNDLVSAADQARTGLDKQAGATQRVTDESAGAQKTVKQLDGALEELGASGTQSGTVLDKHASATQRVTTEATNAHQAVKPLGDGLDDLGEKGNKAGGELDKSAKAVAKLSGTFDAGEAKAQKLAAAQATLSNALANGTITNERYTTLLAAATARWGAHNEAVKQGGISAGQTAQAMRQLPAQLTDVATSLASGMPAWMVLIQQGGQIKDSFGGVMPALKNIASLFTVARVAAGSTLAVMGVLALAYKQGSEEADAYSRALTMSGNAAGTTTGQLQQMAVSVSKVVGTQGKAAEVLAQMAGTGQVGAENLQQFSQAAIELERAVGQSTGETVKNFAELGKAPLQATLKFNETLHYLTVTVYEQIKAMEKQGRNEEAGALAQKTYAEAVSARAKQLEGNLGTIERSWRTLGDAAKGAWNAMLDVGREAGVDTRLERIRKQIATLENAKAPQSGPGADGFSARRETALAALRTQAAALEGDAYQKKAAADQQAAVAKITEEYVAARKANDQWTDAALTNQQKIDKALQTYRNNLAKINAGRAQEGLAPISAKQVKAEEAAIRKSFGEGTFQDASAAAAVAMAKVKANLSLLQDTIKNGDAIVMQALNDGNVTLDAAYAARLANLQADTAAQRQALQMDLAEVDKALIQAKNAAERGPLQQRRVQVEAQLKLLDSSLKEATRQLGIWKTEQERQLATITAKVRVEVAQLTGRFDRAAVEAQLKAQYEGEYKAAGQLADPAEQAAARARIDMLVQAGTAQAEFNAKLAEAQRLQSALSVQEQAIAVLRDQGQISATEAEARMARARADQVPALQGIVAHLQAMKDAMPADAAAAIDQMSASIGQLQNTAAEATPVVVELGTRIQNTAIDSLANAVGQAATNFQSLRSIVSGTLRQIAGDILRSGIKKALSDAFTTNNSTGGGNLFASAISFGKKLFFAEGGLLRGPGTGTSDSIPALVDGRLPIAVSNGEFIQPDRAVRHYGVGFMEAVRTLQFPKPRFAFGGLVSAHQRAQFATGGMVSGLGGSTSGGGTKVVIQVVNQGTPQRVVEQSQQFNGRDTVVSVVLDDLQRGGPIARGIAATQQRR